MPATSPSGPLPADPPARHDGPPGHAVVVEGLVKRYRRTEAVSGLDLVAPAGGITAVLGPNGAGKTTTIECCEGLRRADAGSVRVLGLDPVADARRLRPRVGAMLQDGGLPSTVPAAEVLRHVATMYAHPRDVGELSERLGLHSFARTQVRRLSGGQRQRLALATAVVGRPEVVFLDEPSAGLDPQARLAVWDLVRELRDQGTSVIVTTHQMAEAEQLAEHVVIVDHGRTIAAGSPADLIGTDDVVRLTVRPWSSTARPGTTAEHATALAQTLGSTDGAPHRVSVDQGTLEVHTAADPALLHAMAGWAADAGLLVTSLTTGRRNLEDVFLDLTGRSLR